VTQETPIPRPPFDANIERVLPSIASAVPSSITPDMTAELRSSTAPTPVEELLAGRDVSWREQTILIGDPGVEVAIGIFTPRQMVEPRPAVYWLHGGGMFMGTAYSGADLLIDWVETLSVVALTIEYRLAPEHPDPIPLDDGFAGLVWATENASELGIDPSRLVVAGRSAGGGLAAGVALRSREAGPKLAGQLLICPMLDDRNDSLSARQYRGVGVWDQTSNDTGWTALLGERRGTHAVSEFAAPARATDLSGLPPAFIDVGSAETFRDEDVAYAESLWAAGVQAELHVWPGGIHGFDLFVPQAEISVLAKRARTDWLRRVIAS
jgi:acetyl esterase/lipase